MHTVVIDTDPGLDDAIAILLALAYPEACAIAAVTTVAGNQTIERVTANALKILWTSSATRSAFSGLHFEAAWKRPASR